MINLFLISNFFLIFSGKLITVFLFILFIYLIKKHNIDLSIVNEFKINLYSKSIMILILWMIIDSIFLSIDFYKSITTSFKFAIIVIVGYISILISKKENLKLNKNQIIYSLIIFNLIVIYEHLTDYQITHLLKNLLNFKKNIAHPIDKITALNLLIMPILYHMVFKRNLSYITLIIITITSYIIHPMDAAKFAFFSTIIFVILYEIIGDLFLKLYFTILVLFFFTTPMIIKYLLDINLLKSIILKLPESWIHRTEIWKKTIDLIKDRPLFGYGIGSSSIIDPIIPLHPHNGFLQIWLELGVIGVYVISIIISVIYIKIIKSNIPTILFACFNIFITFSLISFGFWQSWWLASIAIFCIFYNKYNMQNISLTPISF